MIRMRDGSPESQQNPQRERGRSEAVYRALRHAIIDQALLPGDKLPEKTIGDRFGVSRTIVRTVLGRLHAEGLLTLKSNCGAAVARPSLDEAASIFEVRRCLERETVARLAARVTEKELARLERHIAREEQVRTPNKSGSIRVAGEFHVLLAELSGNPVLARYVDELVSRCALILALYSRLHSMDCGISEHRQIVEALRSGDPKVALEVMDRHLDAVLSRAHLVSPAQFRRDIRSALDGYVS
jgi:DNA-binding GntR family transcriptional regulator